MVGSTFADPRVVAAIEKDFVAVLVDMDTETAWVQKHKPQGPPGIIWTDSAGEVLGASVEGAGVEEILTDMDDVLFELEGDDEEGDDEGM